MFVMIIILVPRFWVQAFDSLYGAIPELSQNSSDPCPNPNVPRLDSREDEREPATDFVNLRQANGWLAPNEQKLFLVCLRACFATGCSGGTSANGFVLLDGRDK